MTSSTPKQLPLFNIWLLCAGILFGYYVFVPLIVAVKSFVLGG